MAGKHKMITVGGKAHVAALLQVTERDPDGSPRTFRLRRDEETIDIEGGEEFVIAYVPPRCIARRS